MIEILLSPNEPHTLKYLKINLRHFCVTERLEVIVAVAVEVLLFRSCQSLFVFDDVVV